MEHYLSSAFIYQWQDLIGAFFGSSFAILLSGIGYLIAKKIERIQSKNETLRKIEVITSYSLNSIHTSKQKLMYFVKSAKKLVTEIRSITNPKEFALQTINFPSLAGIYIDPETPLFRVQSYYLHNKLLWIHNGLQDINGILQNLSVDFSRIIKLNETMISLTMSSPNPPVQRIAYAENMEIFANEIERFCNEDFLPSIKNLIQIKIYNEKLRQKWYKAVFLKWKHEGISFKYFKNRDEIKRYYRNLDSIDRIDEEIASEVDSAIFTAEIRAKKLGTS